MKRYNLAFCKYKFISHLRQPALWGKRVRNISLAKFSHYLWVMITYLGSSTSFVFSISMKYIRVFFYHLDPKKMMMTLFHNDNLGIFLQIQGKYGQGEVECMIYIMLWCNLLELPRSNVIPLLIILCFRNLLLVID